MGAAGLEELGDDGVVVVTGFAQRMRRAMEARGIDRLGLRRVLGRSMGVSPQAVDAWFTGRRLPRIEYLAEICGVLDVSADYLLGLKEDMR